MNRDAILATLIGFGVGLLITGALILGPSLSKAFNLPVINLPKFSWPQINSVKPTATPIATPTPKDLTLTIDSPLAEAVVNEDQLLVSGTSLPEAMIVVQGELNEDVQKVGADGKFAGKITLNEGKNEVVVTAYTNNKSITQRVIVYYTPEEF